jgi:hypothetical protein
VFYTHLATYHIGGCAESPHFVTPDPFSVSPCPLVDLEADLLRIVSKGFCILWFPIQFDQLGVLEEARQKRGK